jgi:hypothetical protein
VEGIPAVGSRRGVALDVDGRAHKSVIVPVCVIVGQVEIAVGEQTVSDEKVVGFISGEVAALKGEDGRAGVVEDERHNEQSGELSLERPSGNGLITSIERDFLFLVRGIEGYQHEVKDCKEDGGPK